jgi:hypothetical protein
MFLGKHVKKDCPAHGMADENRAIPECVELPEELRLPHCVSCVGFVGQAGIPDLIAIAEFASKAVNEPVIPFVVNVLTRALNKEQLRRHPRS